MNKLKTWFISDTHDNHHLLTIPKVDCVMFGGDSTNWKNLMNNEQEFYRFKNWLLDLPIKYKIIIAGNHDAWATKKYNRDDLTTNNVIYLEHEYVEIENRLIFGSPYTPTFNDWYFMKDRAKLNKYWEALTDNIDVLLTHGPPKGILDLSYNRENQLEYCGDSALFKALMKLKTPPKLHVFGHIHNSDDCYNQGVREYNNIKFMNVSCVEDGKMSKISSSGIILNI